MVRFLGDFYFGQVLQDMEEYAGKENNVFEPLGGNHKGLRWAKWPGLRPEFLGGKELRFVRLSVRWKDSNRDFSWPVVEENARALWREDGSRCVEHGLYETQLVSYGSAPHWDMWELEMVRQAFEKRGVLVGRPNKVRGLTFKPWEVGGEEPDLGE